MKDILEHPRNENIKFDKESHTYKVDGEIYKGVTSLISKFAPFDADAVSRKIAKWTGRSQQEILDEWAEAGKYGDYVHENVESYVNAGQAFDVPELSLFKSKMEEHNLEPVKAEWLIYDEDIQRASAVDVVCKKDNSIVLIDIKTPEKGVEVKGYKGKTMEAPLDDLPNSRFYKYSLQLSIYKHWVEKNYNISVGNIYILWLRDSQCELIPALNLNHKIKTIYEYA